MKFLFSSCSSTPEHSDNDFHKNLINGMLKNATRYDDDDDENEDDHERNANDWTVDSDLDCQVDDEDNYMIDEDNETEYSRELEKNSKRFKLKQLSLPLSGKFCTQLHQSDYKKKDEIVQKNIYIFWI